MRAEVHAEHASLAEQHWWFRGRRRIFGSLLDDCGELDGGAQILDLGPGGGTNLEVLSGRGEVTAIDLDPGSLRLCGEKGVSRLLRGDAGDPPVREASYDLVCAFDVLEHLDDDLGALRAWSRVLRPGGKLFLSVPALPLLWGRQDVLAGHRRRYRRAELCAKLCVAGYTVERLSFFNTLLFPLILAVRLSMRPFLGRADGHSDLSFPSFGLNGALYRLFAGEGLWLRRHDLPIGVSLLALATPKS